MITLEGDTLGHKHKFFNKLVQDAVNNKQLDLSALNNDNNDIDNLLNIEIACKTRNVEYILDVLKCEDMLYVSRAIKHSRWLITEQQYAHIINPQYLYTQLFPHMLTKAVNKLLLNIRLHLNDEKRYETFYLYLQEAPDSYKWLLNCSTPFIENVVNKKRKISLDLFRRLCKRSAKFLPYYRKIEPRNDWYTFKTISFVLHTATEEYLNILDEPANRHCRSEFGKKGTETIMKKCPNRILDDFEGYLHCIDFPTVAKHMKKEDIKAFLIKQGKNKNLTNFMNSFDYIQYFINCMPSEDRFEYVKSVYLDKPKITSVNSNGISNSDYLTTVYFKTYQWYQYASFNVALTELKKLIRVEISPTERTNIILTLISCAGNNLQDIKTLLQYYYDNHRNEPFKFKIQFVNKLIMQTNTCLFDDEAWTILDLLFHSLEVYIESSHDIHHVQNCLKSIILHNVIHNQMVPEIVEKKFVFDTLKMLQSKLNKEKLFSYLLNYNKRKILNKTIKYEKDVEEISIIIRNTVKLIIDWQKDIHDFPFLREKVQELLKNIKEHSLTASLSDLYNINNLWRRYLFEESFMMCPSEDVYLNVLKHKPELLKIDSNQTNALRTNDTVSLRRFHSKLRIYWSNSFAQEWIKAYYNNINTNTAHKATINGLFTLLPEKRIFELAQTYMPKDSKILWKELDQAKYDLIKNIAKSLYIARPIASLEVVLWYCNGDYLQYATPSLSSITYNLSKVKSREHISKLLEASVSLQKYGLHLTFTKLDHSELKPIISDIWKTSNNSSIRTRLFTYTYNALCKTKEPSVAKELCDVLSLFIDNLPSEENKTIFKKLCNVKNIPFCVQGEVFMKSYLFLASLQPKANGEYYKDNLMKKAPNFMKSLDPNFVVDILGPVKEIITKLNNNLIYIVSSFVLHGSSEDEQCKRFQTVLVPALDEVITSWGSENEGNFSLKLYLDDLLKDLIWGFRKYTIINKTNIPVKLFSEINLFIKQKMNNEDNYIRYTSWKLITEYVKLVADHKELLINTELDEISLFDLKNWHSLPDDFENVWETVHTKISPQMGRTIVKYLKEDTEKYFPSICWLFSKALDNMFSYLLFQRSVMIMETLKNMILDEDFIPCYLVVCDVIPKHGDANDSRKRMEIRQIISAHPSKEVRMHYQKSLSDTCEIIE